jgi:hypothetical protein
VTPKRRDGAGRQERPFESSLVDAPAQAPRRAAPAIHLCREAAMSAHADALLTGNHHALCRLVVCRFAAGRDPTGIGADGQGVADDRGNKDNGCHDKEWRDEEPNDECDDPNHKKPEVDTRATDVGINHERAQSVMSMSPTRIRMKAIENNSAESKKHTAT